MAYKIAMEEYIEYYNTKRTQSVYIPNSLSSFNWKNILIYLSTTFPIVALPISIIHSLTSVGNVNSTAL